MQACRLIWEGEHSETRWKNSAPHNMAVDEVLLQSASSENRSTLRFYGWAQPTLSLGYFQKRADRQGHPSSRQCVLVRRASGGGAIVHHHEITYCFATPIGSRVAGASELYLAFHETLVEQLADLGIPAALHSAEDDLREQAFLCFQRRASGDVICRGHKVAGSAQRRWKNALLQHGSLLIARSEFAPELPGLNEIASFDDAVEAFISPWLRKLTSRLKIDVRPADLTDKEKAAANLLIVEKFANEAWTGKR